MKIRADLAEKRNAFKHEEKRIAKKMKELEYAEAAE